MSSNIFALKGELKKWENRSGAFLFLFFVGYIFPLSNRKSYLSEPHFLIACMQAVQTQETEKSFDNLFFFFLVLKCGSRGGGGRGSGHWY